MVGEFQALKKAELLQKEVDIMAGKVDALVGNKDASLTVKELVRSIVDLTDDVSQANISHWKKDDLRNSLKTLKKRVDDAERAVKAAVVNDVAEAAKKLIADNLNAPFIVHEFKAFSNAKVCCHFFFSDLFSRCRLIASNSFLPHQALDGALKLIKTASPNTAAMFLSADCDVNKVVVLAAAPKVRSLTFFKLCTRESRVCLAQLSFAMAGEWGNVIWKC